MRNCMILKLLARLCGYDRAIETLIGSFMVGHPHRFLVFDIQDILVFTDQNNMAIYGLTEDLPRSFIGVSQ